MRAKAKYSSIFNYPTLNMGGYRRDRMAGGWRSDHEPGSAMQNIVWSICPRNGYGYARKKVFISGRVLKYYSC